MIDQSLSLVGDRLNAHLEAMFKVQDLVVLSPLTDAEGKPAVDARNRLAMFLVNIAQDTMPRGRPTGLASQMSRTAPIHLDVYFMIASGHDAEIYAEGLKLITATLMFFQANPIFTPRNTPEMPAGIEQLSIEISNLRVEELGQLWGNLGGRYVPSVMFKMRSVVIDAGAITAVLPLITSRTAKVQPEGVD